MSTVGSGIIKFLYNNAVTNLWANVHTDGKLLFKTVRMTKKSGVIGNLDLPYTCFNMPDTLNVYHVYELGKITPKEFSLEVLWKLGWLPLDVMINTHQILVNVLISGRIARSDKCYIRMLNSGNVVVAINKEDNEYMIDESNTVDVRFYKALNYGIGNKRLISKTYVKDGSGSSTYIPFVNSYNRIVSDVRPSLYLNGLLLQGGMPSLNSLSNGDALEFISDPSIVRHDSISYDGLTSYSSTLDAINKVIYPISTATENIFTDDIDFYVSGIRQSDGRRVSVLFLSYKKRDIRMLTYKDWTLSVLPIESLKSELSAFSDTGTSLRDVKIHSYQRNNKELKKVTLDSNRLTDLTSLPLNYRLRALSGIDSTVSIWNADNIENCPFNVWVGTEIQDLNQTLLNGVYSNYGAINAIERVQVNNLGNWTLPMLAGNSGGTLIKYDTNGFNPFKVLYGVGNYARVEYDDGVGYEFFIPAEGVGTSLDHHVASGTIGTVTLPDKYGVLCYTDTNGTLELAVLGTDYTLTESGNTLTVSWLPITLHKEKYVRMSQEGSIFTSSLGISDVRDGISLYKDVTYVNDIGLGSLFVWVNGEYQYEGLDYKVMDGKIYLFKMEIGSTSSFSMQVIYSGLPDESLEHVPNTKWGFIKYGYMSYNNNYDLFLNRNNALFINGGAVVKQTLNPNEKFIIPNTKSPHTDGTIWGINRFPQFTADVSIQSIVNSKAEDEALDASLEAYITNMYRQDTESGEIIIPSKYDIVSVYLDAIINDIHNGDLVITTSRYSKKRLLAFLSDYSNLLSIDPTQANLDLDFVEIYPKWKTTLLSVSAVEYAFINKVNELILNSQVTGINLYINIDE